MKTIFILLVVPFLLIVNSSCNKESYIEQNNNYNNITYSDSAQVLFYSSSPVGDIKIYLDSTYIGETYLVYNNNPGCGAQGCVTISISLKKVHTWYATGDFGKTWGPSSLTGLTPGGCNPIQFQ